MNPPLPIAKISVPASIIVAGKQTKEGSSGNDNNDDGDTGAPETTQTVETISSTKVPVQKRPPAAASNTPSSRWEEAKQSQATPAAATDGGASILPPPPRVAGAPPGSSSSSSGSYKPPKWGLAEAPEASGLSLTVLKGGIEVSSISLDNRTHVLLGRQQGIVDVLLEHPSISRKHAILQHGRNGDLFLFDNGSTHGCKVNKAKIPSKEFHRLHVGDVIKFGESTRLYAVEGPEELRPAEYESDNLRNLRLDAGRKQLAAKLAKVKAGAPGEGKGAGDSGEYGISWGFDEDAVAEEEDEDEEGIRDGDGEVELPDYLKTEAQKRRRRDTKVGLMEDSVHKRDAKLFEKLQLKLAKVEHLLTENDRITAKEGGQGGLTEGQQAQLVRNDKTITGVRLQIEEIEETIRSKNKARERGNEAEEGKTGGEKDAGGGGGGKAVGDDEEDDEYYDRTARVVPATSGSDPASKKAEIRARRFGARDKTKKLSAAIPPGGGATAAAAATAVAGTEGSGGGGGREEPVAQSLQALTRRGEAVAEDLERTQAGLAELELEEAEEAGEAPLAEGGGDGSVADPLDIFMSENRKKERNQAILRLTAKRDALLEEQARLKIMTEAARPSMPSLKTSAAAAAAGAGASTMDRAGSDSTAGMLSSTLDRETAAEPGGTAEPKEETGSNNGDPGRVSKRGGGGGNAGEIKEEEKEEEEELPPPRKPVPPSPSMPAAVKVRTVPAGPQLEAGAQSEDGESGQVAATKTNPAGKEENEKVPGTKRRGTPVGASMLPPPPAKRPQRREGNLGAAASAAPAGEKGGGGGESLPPPSGPAAKRKVKGPAAMPPSFGKTSAVSAGALASSEGKTTVKSSPGAAGGGTGRKASGKDVLEGGDVDWVPPKDALEKMAALNQKFGY